MKITRERERLIDVGDRMRNGDINLIIVSEEHSGEKTGEVIFE